MGGHWGVLQVVAWTKMLHGFSQEKGMLTAVKETFDGAHPCAMCKSIQKGQQEEQKQNPLPQEKLEKLSKWVSLLPVYERPQDLSVELPLQLGFTAPLANVSQWDLSPVTPPPRSADVSAIS